jgi:hypothetical protein
MLERAAVAGVEIELSLIVAARQSIRDLSAFRVVAIFGKLSEVRRSLQRIAAFVRHQGPVWDDISTWVPVMLLALFPFDFLAYIAFLLAAVGGALTYVTYEHVPVEKTVIVNETVAPPFWKFWARPQTVTKEVKVPDIETRQVVHSPNPVVTYAVSALVLTVLLWSFLGLLKRFWLWQVDRRERWARRLYERACPG